MQATINMLKDIKEATNWEQLNEAYCPNNPMIATHTFEETKSNLIEMIELRIKRANR